MAKNRTKTSAGTQRKVAESPRDAALRILKVRHQMTLVELTRALKLTATAVRRHLQTLQRAGLITCVSSPQERGRPVNVYRLTEKATTDYFPTGYEELASRMLDTIFDTGGHRAVFEFLIWTNDALSKKLLPALAGTSLKQRVQFLAAYFSDRGYMSDYRDLNDGRFFLYHQNCAILSLATKFRQLCLVELRLIQALTGVKVTRTRYIFKDQPICGYLIEPEAIVHQRS